MKTAIRRGRKAFYTFLFLDELWRDEERVREVISLSDDMWITLRSSLHTEVFVILHRLLDSSPKPRYSLGKLLSKTFANPQLFSKEALAARKRVGDVEPEWLPGYLNEAWTFDRNAIKDLTKELAKHRKIYEQGYEPLRHKVYAHIGTLDTREFYEMVGKTNVQTMEEMLRFTFDLVMQLEDLFENGNKPALGYLRPFDREKFKAAVRAIVIPDNKNHDLPL